MQLQRENKEALQVERPPQLCQVSSRREMCYEHFSLTLNTIERI
jgi:hypothetical protein